MKVIYCILAFLAADAYAQTRRTVTSTVTERRRPVTVTKTDTETDTVTRTAFRFRTRTDTITDTITRSAPGTTDTVTTTAPAETVTDTITETDTATSTLTKTVTSTTTTTSSSSTATSFNGKGFLYVFPNSQARKGCLISAGVWYAGGGTCATYTAAPQDTADSMFTLTSSKGPCGVSADNSTFSCAAGNDMTIFGQTADGNLTFGGGSFFAQSVATGTTQVPIMATAAPVTLDIQWFATS